MKAAAIDRFGPPSVLGLHKLPIPEPEPGEILIALAAAGLSSTISDGCNDDRLQCDNSHLSPDKYEVLDGHFPTGQAMMVWRFSPNCRSASKSGVQKR